MQSKIHVSLQGGVAEVAKGPYLLALRQRRPESVVTKCGEVGTGR